MLHATSYYLGFLFSSSNTPRVTIPDPLPAFVTYKFLLRLPSYKTLYIFLTLHTKHVTWPGLNGCDLRGLPVLSSDQCHKLGWGEKVGIVLGMSGLSTILTVPPAESVRGRLKNTPSRNKYIPSTSSAVTAGAVTLQRALVCSGGGGLEWLEGV